MNPIKVNRNRLRSFTDLPNVGPATAGDFQTLGFSSPLQLTGQDPLELYDRLCAITGQRHDPCVIDMFMSVTSFMDGGPPRPWWDFTEHRKHLLTKTALR